ILHSKRFIGDNILTFLVFSVCYPHGFTELTYISHIHFSVSKSSDAKCFCFVSYVILAERLPLHRADAMITLWKESFVSNKPISAVSHDFIASNDSGLVFS